MQSHEKHKTAQRSANNPRWKGTCKIAGTQRQEEEDKTILKKVTSIHTTNKGKGHQLCQKGHTNRPTLPVTRRSPQTRSALRMTTFQVSKRDSHTAELLFKGASSPRFLLRLSPLHLAQSKRSPREWTTPSGINPDGTEARSVQTPPTKRVPRVRPKCAEVVVFSNRLLSVMRGTEERHC